MRSWSTSIAKPPAKKQAIGISCDGAPILVVGATARPPVPDPPRRHRLHDRRRHDRRLRSDHRHAKGRAAAAPSPLDVAVGRFEEAAHGVAGALWRREVRRPMMRQASCPPDRAGGVSAGWSRRCRRFELSREDASISPRSADAASWNSIQTVRKLPPVFDDKYDIPACGSGDRGFRGLSGEQRLRWAA